MIITKNVSNLALGSRYVGVLAPKQIFMLVLTYLHELGLFFSPFSWISTFLKDSGFFAFNKSFKQQILMKTLNHPLIRNP